LLFRKRGRDGSAKCDIEQTDEGEEYVYGVVFLILSTEKALLDGHEGLGRGYGEKSVFLFSEACSSLTAVTYFATHIDANLKPYHWYKEHVLRGASEHNLPPDYIQRIQAIDSIADPNERNHQEELSVYC